MLWGYSLQVMDWFGLRLMFVGAFLGAVALLVSLASAYVLYRVADDSQKALVSTTASLAKESERQRTLTEEAKRDAASATQRAAEANEKAEAERLARMKIEERLAPRRLTSEQLTALTTLFTRYQGRTIRVASYSLDVDAALFGAQILKAAQDANLLVQDRRMSEGPLGAMFLGVSVTGTDDNLVNDTIVALQSFGIVSSNESPAPAGGIHQGGQAVPLPLKIFVGVKPLPQ